MSSCSLSMAPTAMAAASCSLSPTYIDHVFLHLFPCISHPTLKTPLGHKTSLNFSPFSSLSLSSTICAAFDGVEVSQEEDPERIIGETVLHGKQVENAMEENETLESVEAGRLYVGNLPFTVTPAELSEIFAEAGRVVSVEVIYGKAPGRSRGFAFVDMGSVKAAEEAIRLFDGAEIGGRNAKVNFPEVPKGGERESMSLKARISNKGFVDSPHKMYVGNLSWSLTSEALRETFAQQPGFTSAKVIFDRDTGRSRGFGFVTFSSAEEVESALEAMNGLDVEGRSLNLQVAEQRTSSAV
ncbi:33 kDa ribonucleoprotein, chloroplastic-like [Primulina huaijiensis]|uniref:33 kDa ribonucleoprotein, chloroplastic-like n=1 Tax=Primulina huaijiensis TaxID=1492673 RepID=UPI003CC6E99A